MALLSNEQLPGQAQHTRRGAVEGDKAVAVVVAELLPEAQRVTAGKGRIKEHAPPVLQLPFQVGGALKIRAGGPVRVLFQVPAEVGQHRVIEGRGERIRPGVKAQARHQQHRRPSVGAWHNQDLQIQKGFNL